MDENLGDNKLAAILRAAGYKVITHRERYGNVDGIPDPKVIADCGSEKTILLTADADLETQWAAEIRHARIAVVILTNNCDGAAKWGQRLTDGKEAILKQLRVRRKPFALKFSRDAEVTQVRLYRKTGGRIIPISCKKPKPTP